MDRVLGHCRPRHPKLDAAVAQQIQCRHAFGHPGGVVGGELDDAMPQTDLPGALAGGAQKDFRRGAVRIFFQKVVLDFPGIIHPQSIG
jgi:hypothetical protein